MKNWSSEHVFDHPWDTVVRAAWRKYPNPFNPSVVGIDVIDRKVNNNGVLQSHRLMSTEWGLPDFAAKILGMSGFCYVSEHSAVDRKDKIMALKSRNLTFCNILTIEEYLKYSPHPEDRSKTSLKQHAKVTVKGVPFSGYLEKLVVDGMDKNASKGRNAMEWVISRLKTEGEPKQITKSANNSLNLQNLDTKLKKETEELKQSVDNLLTNATPQSTPL